jgi:hypothetical protein
MQLRGYLASRCDVTTLRPEPAWYVFLRRFAFQKPTSSSRKMVLASETKTMHDELKHACTPLPKSVQRFGIYSNAIEIGDREDGVIKVDTPVHRLKTVINRDLRAARDIVGIPKATLDQWVAENPNAPIPPEWLTIPDVKDLPCNVLKREVCSIKSFF